MTDVAHRVSIALLVHNRRREVLHTLSRLVDVPYREIIVVDSGSTDGTSSAVAALDRPEVQLITTDNVAVAGRNIGVAAASGEFVLILDDDAYPIEGTVERLVAAFDADPTTGIVGGFMVDIDQQDQIVQDTELGTFDWFMRGGRTDDGGGESGLETWFFCEGGCMVRREAYLAVGGFFEPYFFTHAELDLGTRMIAEGWGLRYATDAPIHHRKAQEGRTPGSLVLELRVRNQLWYFLRFLPWWSVVWHTVFYLLFDLLECTYHGHPGAWWRGVTGAVRGREVALSTRRVVPLSVRRRAERDRAALHVRLLIGQLRRRLRPHPAARNTSGTRAEP